MKSHPIGARGHKWQLAGTKATPQPRLYPTKRGPFVDTLRANAAPSRVTSRGSSSERGITNMSMRVRIELRCLVIGGGSIMSGSLLDNYASIPIDDLVASIAKDRRRPLRIVDADFGGLDGTICGLWLALPVADLIFVADDLSGMHRDHVILHELAHPLLITARRLGGNDRRGRIAVSLAEARPRETSPATKSLRRRAQEAAAEQLASAVAASTRRTQRSAWVDDASARQVARVLGRPQ